VPPTDQYWRDAEPDEPRRRQEDPDAWPGQDPFGHDPFGHDPFDQSPLGQPGDFGRPTWTGRPVVSHRSTGSRRGGGSAQPADFTRPAGSRRPKRSRMPGVRRSHVLLTVGVVALVSALGGWALMATKGNPPARHAGSAVHHPVPVVAKPSQTAGPGSQTVSITWVGDMTFGTLDAWPSAGTGSLLADVKPDLHSDLTIGNLESALGTLPMSKCSPGEADCYQFEAPPYTARDLKRDGFAAVNVANNHTLDAGPPGETSTDAALRAAHLKWTGRPGQITYVTRNGITIALLGFAPWSYDANMLDIPAAEALVRQAKKHAQVVIVIEHAGAEGTSAQHVRPGEEYFLGQDRGNSIAFTHGVIDAGADLVMGSGPHVLRGFQWYHGHLIAYSLGNFCGYNTLALDGVTAVSAILHVTLNASGQFVRGSITPLRLVSPGMPEPDPAGAAIGLINSLSRADFARNGAVHISAAGKIMRA
jgi:Bacterial capsule synthesis protein PGA_cap